MAQEQKESIDRTFDQFMQPDLGFRTGVVWLFWLNATQAKNKRVIYALSFERSKQREPRES